MDAAISDFEAPWFNKGWISDLANTPQREAIEYNFWCSIAKLFISVISKEYFGSFKIFFCPDIVLLIL